MKYYSELLTATFNTEKECLEAEKKYKEEKDKKEKEEAARVANISKRKKELSKAIEDADAKVAEANKLYSVAKDQAAEILEKSNKQVREILDQAEANVKEAQKEKLNAILAFNKEFGSYKVTYTGEKAAEEFNRSFDRFNSTLMNFFKMLF